jgi:hypothetical protein
VSSLTTALPRGHRHHLGRSIVWIGSYALQLCGMEDLLASACSILREDEVLGWLSV